ncbi:MAG TPA: heme-binding protein [Pseudolabrys sp.]
MRRLSLFAAAACTALILGTSAHAQQQGAPPPPAPPFGTPITFDQAKKVAAAAEAEAKKNNLNSAIAIIEPTGALVYFGKMDGTQYGATNVAMDKALSAALYRRPTAAFDAGLRAGNTYLLTLRNMNAVPGGIPIVVDGKLIGAIGVSGGSGPDDVKVAEAGAAALK